METNDDKAPQVHSELVPADDLLIVELDDRLEFGAAVLEGDLALSDLGCNGKSCTQNGSCP